MKIKTIIKINHKLIKKPLNLRLTVVHPQPMGRPYRKELF